MFTLLLPNLAAPANGSDFLLLPFHTGQSAHQAAGDFVEQHQLLGANFAAVFSTLKHAIVREAKQRYAGRALHAELTQKCKVCGI